MGRIRKGANGGFSGKAGSVIGSNWRDIDYIRGLPKLSGKPATQRQLEQRAKFQTAVNFLQSAKSVLNLGFRTQKTGRATGYNIGLQKLLAEAITGVYPAFAIDYAKVTISAGGLGSAIGPAMLSAQPATLTITWAPSVNGLNAFVDDQAKILMYNEAKNQFILNDTEVLRSEGMYETELPAVYSGDQIHAWIFFTDRNNALTSNSIYVGSVMLS
ncbi:MAG TPA: DUF6266 family protein [Sphingobacteriaceae bacterium]